MSIENRTALVTGASRGIGRAIALKLGETGYHVAINYLNNESQADEVVETIKKSGLKSVAVQGDVQDPKVVKQIFETVKEHLGSVEILVNNAGILHHSPIQFVADSDWERIIDVNLKSVFNCIREASRDMTRAKWGRIINISSDAGRTGETMGAPYSASKAGILGLTKASAREFARYGITVNAITPGFIETDMTGENNEATRQKQLDMIPEGKFGLPEDIAELAVFLASDKCGYITGQTISVDGGLFMG